MEQPVHRLIHASAYLPSLGVPTLVWGSFTINNITVGESAIDPCAEGRGRVLRIRGKTGCFPRPRQASSGLFATGLIFSTSILLFCMFFRALMPAVGTAALSALAAAALQSTASRAAASTEAQEAKAEQTLFLGERGGD